MALWNLKTSKNQCGDAWNIAIFHHIVNETDLWHPYIRLWNLSIFRERERKKKYGACIPRCLGSQYGIQHTIFLLHASMYVNQTLPRATDGNSYRPGPSCGNCDVLWIWTSMFLVSEPTWKCKRFDLDGIFWKWLDPLESPNREVRSVAAAAAWADRLWPMEIGLCAKVTQVCEVGYVGQTNTSD